MKGNMRWLRLLLFIPLLVVLCGTNYYEDPANIFHDYSKDIANAVLNGEEAYFGSGNGDERSVKMHMIKGMPKQVDCITLGPSLSMGIRKQNVGTESYYNLSASGLNFNEFMADIALLEVNNIKYDRVIYCVDSYFFDETFATRKRNAALEPYTEYMMKILDGEEAAAPEESGGMEVIKTQLEQAFSITYLQSSFDFIRSNESILLKEKRWGIIDETTKDLAHYVSDGSWVYAIDIRDNTVEDVINHANNYNIERQFAYDRHLSEYYKDYFRKLIQYLLDKGISVEFYLCPLCPTLWERVEADSSHYFMLNEIENFVKEMADDYSIKITGSYNPYNVGITDADFWDSRHVRHDRLDSFFDFKE